MLQHIKELNETIIKPALHISENIDILPMRSYLHVFYILPFEVTEKWSIRNRYALDEKPNWPRHGCKSNTDPPLPPIEPLSACKLLQELHH